MEQVCRELGLQYATEENAGRIYVNLQGAPVTGMPPLPGSGPSGYYQQPHHGSQQHHGGGGYPGQQQHGGGHGQGQAQDQIEAEVRRLLPRILRKIEKNCCVVM